MINGQCLQSKDIKTVYNFDLSQSLLHDPVACMGDILNYLQFKQKQTLLKSFVRVSLSNDEKKPLTKNNTKILP